MKRAEAFALAFAAGVVCMYGCEAAPRATAGDAGGGAAVSDAGFYDGGDDAAVADAGPKPWDCEMACQSLGDDCRFCQCCEPLLCHENACVECLSLDENCRDDAECCQPWDPSYGAWCDDETGCVECAKTDTRCESDYDCCPADDRQRPAMCTSKDRCAPICETDGDCTQPLVCLPNGECVSRACSADVECGAAERCCSGACRAECGYGPPDGCAIVSPGGVIFKDRKMRLHAIAWKGDPKKGAQLVPWTPFSWSSSDPAVVAVDPDTGEIIGGGTEGSSEISATSGGLGCGEIVFTNYIPLPAGTGAVRVVVYDERSGKPVEGADVIVGSNPPVRTDAAGVVAIASAPGDVHVFHEGYTWVSVVGLNLADYIVHLSPEPDDTIAGGFRGHFDFSSIRDKAVQTGLAGMSFPDNLLDFSSRSLFGELIQTPIWMDTSCGDIGNHEGAEPWPAPLEWRDEHTCGPDTMPRYRVLGRAGLRAAWGFGNGLSSLEVTSLVQLWSLLTTGELPSPPGMYLSIVRRVLDRFSHAVVPVFEVEPIPKIVTPCIDRLTGIPDFGVKFPCKALGKDEVPLVDSPTMADYEHFPELGLKLSTKKALKTTLNLPGLPALGSACPDTVTLMGASALPGMGLVPLGFGAGLDDPWWRENEPDCTVNSTEDDLAPGQLVLRISPNHAGTEGNDYVLVAMTTADDEDRYHSPHAASVRIVRTGRLEEGYDLSGMPFPGFGESALFDGTTRLLSGPPSDVGGATFYRYKLSGEKGDWIVYSPLGSSPAFLPVPPNGPDDRAPGAEMTVYALSAGGATLSDLVSPSGDRHLPDLGEVVDAFSRLTCLRRITPENPDYPEKCEPENPWLTDGACNPACEVR